LYVAATDGYLHAIGAAAARATATPAPTANASEVTAPEETGTPDDHSGTETAGEDDHEHVLPPPHTVITRTILRDSSGFVGGPAVSPDGSVFIAGGAGVLHAVTQTGDPLWETALPALPAGTPVIVGSSLFVLDRAGLTAFSFSGELLWRFEHATSTGIAGPVAGPDGTLYYTLETGSKGAVQAVSPEGEALWITTVGTFSYYRPPIVTPNGQLVLFKNEAFSTIDGSRVDLNLEFEPAELIAGADRQLYLLFGETFVRWSLVGNAAVLAEERVVSSFGNPVYGGALPDGTIWLLYRSFVAWYAPDGTPIRISGSSEAWIEYIAGPTPDGTLFACGRNRVDMRQQAMSNCLALSILYDVEPWNVIVDEDLVEFKGVAYLGTVVFAANAEGNLYRIEFEVEP
jgi:hypothetical protein